MANEKETRAIVSGAWHRLAGAYIDADHYAKAKDALKEMPILMKDAYVFPKHLNAEEIERSISFVRIIEEIEEYFVPATFGSGKEVFSEDIALFDTYKLAPILTTMLESWGAGDAMTFYTACTNANQNYHLTIDLDNIIKSVVSTKLVMNDYNNSFKLLSVYKLINNYSFEQAKQNNSFLTSTNEMSVSESIISDCGSYDKGKLLIIFKTEDKLYIPYETMASLPDELLPSSLDEIGYVLIIEHGSKHSFNYNNYYSSGRQKYTDVKLFSAPNQRVVKSFSRVEGTPPPTTYTYYNYPPEHVFGGDPDHSEINKRLLEAIEYLLG